MANQVIRKLTIGAEMQVFYQVGQAPVKAMPSLVIVKITAEKEYQIKRYLIHAQFGSSTIIWKEVENLPVMVEYELTK